MNILSDIPRQEVYDVMLKNYPDVMDINHVCEILNISTKTGYRLLRNGELKSIKIGRAYRVPKAYLLSYLYKN